MRKTPILVLALIISAMISTLGCDRDRPSVSPQVRHEFFALVDSLDTTHPGRAYSTVASFRERHAETSFADTVDVERARMRSLLVGRYSMARELARDGEFDAAESILRDLALASKTEEGSLAEQHLAFDFYFQKAQALLMQQRAQESEVVARMLLERDLSPLQRQQAETLLDGVSMMGSAMRMADRSQLRSACQSIRVALATAMVEEGRYPRRFGLGDLDSYVGPGVQREVAAIEDYRTTRDGYELTVVGKSGEEIRIVNGEILD